MPGGDGLVLIVEQARQHFVMQDLAGIAAAHHRLEEQAEATLAQRIVEQGVPTVRVVTDGVEGLM